MVLGIFACSTEGPSMRPSDSNHKSATFFLNEPRWTIYHLNTLPFTPLYCSFFIYKIAKYCMYPHNNKTHIEFPLREDHNTSCENITKSRLSKNPTEYWIGWVSLPGWLLQWTLIILLIHSAHHNFCLNM